jgi:ATP-binding cassette subfamily B protein/subfamily B ATP-binding cassette protein MsbA
MVYELAESMFSRLMRVSLTYHNRGRVGDYLERLSNDAWCVYSIVADLLVSPLQRMLTLIAIAWVAWWLNPLLTLLSFGVAPIIALSVAYFGPRLKRRATRGREAQSQLTRFVHQTVTAIPLVQVFAAEQRNQATYDALVDDVVAVSQQGVLVNKSYELVNGLANSVGRAIVIFAGGLQVIAGDLSVGSLLVFLAYLRRIQEATSGLLTTYASLKTSEANLDRVLELLDAEEEVKASPNARPLPFHEGSGGAHIRFENTTFGYNPDRPVISDVDFEIMPSEKIAVVGPTGAGKSTLMALICRFYDPNQGRILFNGRDLREITLESLRAQIAIVLQEPFLLPLTVAENIAYGTHGATREQIVDAATAANAHEFIERLPKGYDSVIGERGSTLSGGQKQRLAIARALVRDASVVILDEPTSALDAKTEADLLDALSELCRQRTTFMIAHRLSTIRNADRILVLDRGCIVESGTHEDLLSQKGLYEQMHAIQFGSLGAEVST